VWTYIYTCIPNAGCSFATLESLPGIWYAYITLRRDLANFSKARKKGTCQSHHFFFFAAAFPFPFGLAALAALTGASLFASAWLLCVPLL
jgi:hypothetical protein